MFKRHDDPLREVFVWSKELHEESAENVSFSSVELYELFWVSLLSEEFVDLLVRFSE